MTRRSPINYTEGQKALMWERWQKGESLHQISRLFDRNHTSVQGIQRKPQSPQSSPCCAIAHCLSRIIRIALDRRSG
jgi:hypothetical protein